MKRGFSLVEVVVAVTVLQVGVLGTLSLLALAGRTLTEAEQIERALLAATAVTDSLRSAEPPLSDGSRTGRGFRVAWRAEGGEAFTLDVEVDTRPAPLDAGPRVVAVTTGRTGTAWTR